MQWPIAKIFKHDARSKVWQTLPVDDHEYVIKLFTFNTLKQQFLAIIGLHPAQQEIRAHKRLEQLKIPVVKILCKGRYKFQFLLVTQAQGRSVHNWILTNFHHSPFQQRQSITKQLGTLVGQLLKNGYYFKDMKQSNVIIDQQNQLKLIDAGSIKKTCKRNQIMHAIKMLGLLNHTAHQAAMYQTNDQSIKLTQTDQMRVVKAVLKIMPELKTDLIASIRKTKMTSE